MPYAHRLATSGFLYEVARGLAGLTLFRPSALQLCLPLDNQGVEQHQPVSYQPPKNIRSSNRYSYHKNSQS